MVLEKRGLRLADLTWLAEYYAMVMIILVNIEDTKRPSQGTS